LLQFTLAECVPSYVYSLYDLNVLLMHTQISCRESIRIEKITLHRDKLFIPVVYRQMNIISVTTQ